MRLYEFFTDDIPKEPRIQWHMIDYQTAFIDKLEVFPQSDRGKGIGKSFYVDWESKLPNTVCIIKLYASNAIKFWIKLGFVPDRPNQSIN